MGGGPPDGRLNVIVPGRKRALLPWKSITAPALGADPGMFSPNRLYLAWVDQAGYLWASYCLYDNIEELADPARRQRIETNGVAERSFTSPSLGFSGNQLFLSWAGVDKRHTVNFKVLEGVGVGGVYLTDGMPL
ncbi:hypothetical protein [Frankia sp. QA3]|uniref:hypothetical protein n=1 Tax=Frankia sp. QA3 TaxID=710111 RepID=UPI000269CDF0|nr:hypothetical protein [Frankia sp. QA3]EIV96160.1 hypothetical protein FraQA3DRAFT_6028 [Frankia sp. QA3]